MLNGVSFTQGGTSISGDRGGGLGPHVKFGGKIWGKIQLSSLNKRKNLGPSVTTKHKSWGKFPILGSYLKFRGQNLGFLLPIFLEAKFGAPTRISEAKFGAKPLRPPNIKVPPWKVLQNTEIHFALLTDTIESKFQF